GRSGPAGVNMALLFGQLSTSSTARREDGPSNTSSCYLKADEQQRGEEAHICNHKQGAVSL
ncbi:hypothetical protein KUCAC02_002018, partial [Chaenocephalus aceratus]